MLLSILREVSSDAEQGRRTTIRAVEEPKGLPDEALVGRAVAGDRRAVAALYERHVAYVLGMAARMLRSRDDGEDVVQDAFAIAIDNLKKLRDPRAFRSWVAQITVRLVKRRIRRRGLLILFGQNPGEEDATLEALAAPSCNGEARAELALIDLVLAQLPAVERLAWMLRYVEGEDLESVATLCGCSLATAKRRIAAATARVSAHVTIEEGA